VTSPDTLARVEHACVMLRRDDKPVTFTNVAAQAGISRTSLYRDSALRAVVDEHRTAVIDPRTLTGLTSEVGHLRTAVEALAQRVRRHEEQLRRLERDSRPRRKAN
jgi:hypothetical protein